MVRELTQETKQALRCVAAFPDAFPGIRTAVAGHALHPADITFLVAWTLIFGGAAAWRYRAGQQRGALA